MRFQIEISEIGGASLALNVPVETFDKDGAATGLRPEAEVAAERQKRMKQGMFRVSMNDITDIGNPTHKALMSDPFWSANREDKKRKLYRLLDRAAEAMATKCEEAL